MTRSESTLGWAEFDRNPVDTQVREILANKRIRDKVTLLMVFYEQHPKHPVARVFQTTWGPVVVTFRPKTGAVESIEPLTDDDEQTFKMPQIRGFRFAPVPASMVRERIRNGDKRMTLKDAARRDDRILRPGDLTTKQYRDTTWETRQALKSSTDDDMPVLDELIAYTERQLKRANQRLAAERGRTPDSPNNA